MEWNGSNGGAQLSCNCARWPNRVSRSILNVPFGFRFFGSFSLAAQKLLDRICQRYHIHARITEWEAHTWVHRRLSFAVLRGVADQLVGRRLDSFGWWFVMFLLLSLLRARCAGPRCLESPVIVIVIVIVKEWNERDPKEYVPVVPLHFVRGLNCLLLASSLKLKENWDDGWETDCQIEMRKIVDIATSFLIKEMEWNDTSHPPVWNWLNHWWRLRPTFIT